jgi:hypothetical protein
MSEVWRDFIVAAFFAASVAFNFWTGKTWLFPWATCDREEEFNGFWLSQGLLAVAAILAFFFGIAAAL